MDITSFLNDAPGWAVSALYAILALASAWTVFFFAAKIVYGVRVLASVFAERDDATRGAGLFYLAALAGMAVSVDTSWLFFGDVLGVNVLWVRGIMFFVLELAQIACGWGMRASIRQHDGHPGPARLIAWTLCAVSAYMAWSLSGFWVGIARVVLGPILSLIMLHLALGIEVRGLKIRTDSMWLRLSREFRERFLALFGLGDEGRDAKTIARERALAKATEIRMTTTGTKKDVRRFVKALAKAGIMDDQTALDLFLRRMQLSTNAERVWGAQYGMPFDLPETTETATETTATVDETPQVKGHETTETRPISLTSRSADQEAEIATLMQLMRERGGADLVSWQNARDLVGLSKATACRRLAVARQRYQREQAS